MSPELREYVLSLPLDVRLELAKCEGPYWHLVGTLATVLSADSVRDDPLEDLVTVSGSHRRACLPVSPIAIALHAAKLLGAFEATITVDTGGGYTYANTTASPSEGEEVPYQFADVESDPTGHRAVIGLLRKVMEAKAS